MHIYDTLIIGSGYSSVGYALAKENCIICEQNEICDTHFYLPMKNFTYHEYEPKSKAGKELKEIYSKLGLFKNGMQNTNGFESALCSFLAKKNIEVLLKCRVIEIKKAIDNINIVTVITNSGLEEIFTKKVLDMRRSGENCKKFITALFVSNKIECDIEKIKTAFSGCYIEKAFYAGRYALYIPVDKCDVNSIKLDIYKRWTDCSLNAKILSIAPAVAVHMAEARHKDIPYDDLYLNPIEAFEAGLLHAKEE